MYSHPEGARPFLELTIGRDTHDFPVTDVDEAITLLTELTTCLELLPIHDEAGREMVREDARQELLHREIAKQRNLGGYLCFLCGEWHTESVAGHSK